MFVALYTAIWGFVLLLPVRTFELPAYKVLVALTSEEIYGSFALLAGCVLQISLVLNPRSLVTRLVLAATATYWILTAFAVIVVQGMGSPGPYHFMLVAVTALWCAWRLARLGRVHE